jgi:hypothetical protein
LSPDRLERIAAELAEEVERRGFSDEELERLEALAAPVRELDEGAEALVRAALVASGYRRRKGEWRMKRGA